MDKSTQKMLISEWIWRNLQGVDELSKELAERHNGVKGHQRLHDPKARILLCIAACLECV
jgi:hypothetical protein